MIKVGIAGATGYTGQELVRLLLQHPQVKIQSLLSKSHAGQSYSSLFPQFLGSVDLVCSGIDNLHSAAEQCDVMFLALPHGMSTNYISDQLLQKVKVVDLGADFRLKDLADYSTWYQSSHPFPELVEEAVYGLPEWRRDEIKNARLVANPGCYATCTILSLLPLVSSGLLKDDSFVVDAKSGVSGAGRALNQTVHFAECNETIKAYKVASHRHTPEIEQELSAFAPGEIKITFTPHLVPMSRGILVTAYCKVNQGVKSQDLLRVYATKYGTEPFVKIVSGESPETRWVRGSNNCHIGMTVDERTGNAIVIGALDNLIKGAAGQAIQNMNLLCAMPESMGLGQVSVFP